MAVMRFRKKRVFLVVLVACLFWLMYMLSMLPSNKGKDSTEREKLPEIDHSISRKYFTTAVHPEKKKIEPVDVVIAPPQLQQMTKFAHLQSQINGSANKNETERNKDGTNSKGNFVAFGNLIKNKTVELGIKLRNKTVEVGQKVKNKTLEQLAMMGVVESKTKTLPQMIFVQTKWNLTVSFEDIGHIMKETQFLNKVDPLNLNGPILLSTRNRTANFTYTMPLKFGFCDCFDRYCVCCSQIANKRLHLNSTACSNFTFVSKTHELDLQFSLDGKPVYKTLISADKSPLLCLGSNPKVADICVHFFNMTFKVNEHNAHQTQLLGCTDLSLNLYNKTIGAFPIDCFQIPGDPNQVHKERKFNMMFNWVP